MHCHYQLSLAEDCSEYLLVELNEDDCQQQCSVVQPTRQITFAMNKFICPSPHKQENLYVKSKHCPCLSFQPLIVLRLDIFERSKLQQESCHGNTADNKCQALDSGVPHLHWVAHCRRILRWPHGHSIRIAHSFLPCTLLQMTFVCRMAGEMVGPRYLFLTYWMLRLHFWNCH